MASFWMQEKTGVGAAQLVTGHIYMRANMREEPQLGSRLPSALQHQL